MKIVGVEVRPVRMRLSEPYEIAYESVGATTNVFLMLETESHVGLGCAAPDRAVTGETTESVVTVLTEVVEPALRGADPLRREELLELLRPQLAPHRSARAALDMALLDLLGKAAGLPVWRLLGGYRDRIATSVTIGIVPEAETLAAARALVERGFGCLKLKGGADVESDIARVLRVREELGPEVELRFDANQGYDFDETVAFVEGTRGASLELLEQPTSAGELALLGRVTRRVHLPVMADESLTTLRDAFRLAEGELVDLVNIKVMKVGGVSAAMSIDSVARAGDIATMVGCFDESEVGIAAGLALALARPNVAYADLDGHLDLIGDPAAGSLRLENGAFIAPEAPGLGVSVDWE